MKKAKAAPGLLFAGADMGARSLSAGASECTSCPDYSDSPAGSSAATDCLCNAGYSGFNGGACTACVAGQYKPDIGQHSSLSLSRTHMCTSLSFILSITFYLFLLRESVYTKRIQQICVHIKRMTPRPPPSKPNNRLGVRTP